MEILCTRPGCPRPRNSFPDLDDLSKLKTAQQKFCTSCGMPLILAGHYIPSRLLGKGGFGAAFLARDRYTPTMRQCVVKQFQPAEDLSQQDLEIAQELFEREAAVLEKLGSKHPQIPDLYAFFPLLVPSRDPSKSEQFFYLVQEFIDGQNLEEELAAKGQFSEEEVRFILTETLPILQFVHNNSSIHRDIKPSNIMRDREGILYLLDFGAVKQVTTGGVTNFQKKSTGIYSLGFAPPEQVSGAQVYPSTDLYALAATCVNLLTGKPSDIYYSYNSRWNWRPYAPNVSDRLAGILDRMLSPTPSDRFQSADEVLRALESSSKNKNKSKPIVNSPQQNLPSPPPGHKSFSLVEIISSAAFTGFEGALLYISLVSWLSFSGVSMGLLGTILAGTIFALTRRVIEKVDLVIIVGISVVLIWFFPVLRGDLAFQFIIIVSVLAGASAIAITALFRLIYLFISRLL